MLRLILIDARFDDRTEVIDQALHGPRRRISESADRVTLDLFRHVKQQIDLAFFGFATFHPFENAPHPAGAFAARRALAAALVLVEIGDAPDRADDVGRFVHHDYGRGAEARAELAQRIEIHRDVHRLFRRDATNRRAAGNDGEQVIPAAANAAAVLVDQLSQRNTHFLFDDARTLDVAGNLKELRAGVVRKTESRKPARAAA